MDHDRENAREGYGSDGAPFQRRVRPWMQACFGEEISADRVERNHRFLEEALELAQANGCTRSEARQLVDYVFDRPLGEIGQEIGGVMVTLAALCLAVGEDMHVAGETELARIWTKVEAIRAKQAAKPRHSPLPAHPSGGPREWRCFHCDEVFTEFEAARNHFGDHEMCDPVCSIMAREIRDMERELERYRAEDSDKDRQFHALQADHRRALRVEEEKGYEKGLRDGEALFGEPYAYEYGQSNGDGTFGVVIERRPPARPVPDWHVKPLYARDPSVEGAVS